MAANIRMNNILPGFIDSLPEKQTFRERIPLGRYGTTDEIAHTVVLLLSDGTSTSRVRTSVLMEALPDPCNCL